MTGDAGVTDDAVGDQRLSLPDTGLLAMRIGLEFGGALEDILCSLRIPDCNAALGRDGSIRRDRPVRSGAVRMQK